MAIEFELTAKYRAHILAGFKYYQQAYDLVPEPHTHRVLTLMAVKAGLGQAIDRMAYAIGRNQLVGQDPVNTHLELMLSGQLARAAHCLMIPCEGWFNMFDWLEIGLGYDDAMTRADEEFTYARIEANKQPYAQECKQWAETKADVLYYKLMKEDNQ